MTLLKASTNRIRRGAVRFGIPGFLSERGRTLKQKGVIRGILVIAICVGMAPAVAQPISDVPMEAWVARYDGPDGLADSARSLAVDKAGNVYVTGEITRESCLPSWPPFPPNCDYYSTYAMIKYDSAGNELWIARHGANAWSLVVDEASNVYVTGEETIKYDSDGNELWVANYGGPDSYGSASSLALDKAGNVYVTGESSDDYVTIKYDSAGNELWVARYDGPDSYSYDSASSLAVDEAGNVYVTGASSGDYATIKYDGAGNELWVARYDGSGNHDSASSLALDEAGNVYVTGGSSGDGTDKDYATIKYDSAGNELWVARYDGPGDGSDRAESLAVDEAGNVYVTGHSSGDYATIKYIQPLSGSDPRPTITANRSSGPLEITQGTRLKIRVSLDPGNQLFKKADWWIAYLGPSGLHCLALRGGWVPCNEQVIPTVSIPLLKIPSVQILNDSSLPVGAYAFLMGVDMNMNGQLDGDSLYYDLVVVNIEDQ